MQFKRTQQFMDDHLGIQKSKDKEINTLVSLEDRQRTGAAVLAVTSDSRPRHQKTC